MGILKQLKRFFFLAAAALAGVSLCGYSQAGPTLVVDVNTGALEIHVGVTGALSNVLGQSGGNGGDSLSPGDWALSSFSITSSGSSLNTVPLTTPGDVLPTRFQSLSSGYAEVGFVTHTFPDPTIIPLALTYDTSVDARDLDFTSLDGIESPSNPTSRWNTIYVDAIPEPNAAAILATLGLLAPAARRRVR